jgi:hypothetical protein
MPVFPSVEWFEAVKNVANESGIFRKLGTCDAEIGVQVGDQLFEIDFEAFEVTAVSSIDANRKRDLDFTLVMSPEAWREMIENIRANGRADLDHTLNSLDLNNPDEFAQSDDYYRRDKFYRFNQTFQDFFDTSAKVETTFADFVGA